MCNYCGGKGVIKDGKTQTITFCQHCIDARKLMGAIKVAIGEAKKSKDKSAITSLTAISAFLPKYPVMASLEAEAQGMPQSFIEILKTTFGVRDLR